jgi:hypothetical protein
MSAIDQARADAANDSYNNRSLGDIDPQKSVPLGGQKYQVFGYANDPVTGFHATAYRSESQPYNIIIAYRGTDPGLFSGATAADRAAHALTTVQDIAVDATMVRDAVNLQKAAADAFTAEILAKAAALGIPMDRVFVAGHSLGGTLAEIEAAEWGLTGTTLNAYGAAGLLERPPKPGCHLTNYVMSGDVVGAANRHIGDVVQLTSPDDLQSLRDGRYLDAPAGSPAPNPLLAMRLSDHGGAHFSGADSVLAPARLAQYQRNYVEHKAAVDHYRHDIYHERGELAAALHAARGREGSRQAQLPPDVQQQLDEYIAVHADRPLRAVIGQNAVVRDAGRTLQQGADAVRTGYGYVQAQDERAASMALEAGQIAAPLSPGAGVLGLAAGEAAHLHGQAVAAAGRFVDSQLQSAKGAVEQGASILADAAVAKMHDPGLQAGAVDRVNHVIDTYGTVQTAALAATETYRAAEHVAATGVEAVKEAALQGFVTAGQVVRQGIGAVEQAASRTDGMLAQPGRSALRDAPSVQADVSSVALPSYAGAATSADVGHLHGDPRRPENPDHALYGELHRRIPEASENRLLQFTAACHAKGITSENLEWVHLDEKNHAVVLGSGGLTPQFATVDISLPSPKPAQSIQQMLDFDAGQALLNQQIQQQLQRIDMQVPQGGVMGGRQPLGL